MSKKLFAKILILVSVSVFIGAAAISSAAGIKRAQAGLLNNLWNDFIAPFVRKPTSTDNSTNINKNITDRGNIHGNPQEILYKPVLDYEKAVVNAIKKVSPAVVSITISKNVPIIEQCPYNPFSDLPPEFHQFFGGDQFFQFSKPCQKGYKMEQVGSGSGFIISPDGLILTNKHVVIDKKASYTVFTNDGKKYKAKVLSRDPLNDLAVIKIDARNLPSATLGDSDSLELGQTAIAIGNALGEFRNTVSAGIISGLSRTISASGVGISETIHGLIQTDAAINPGNSGGPLINLRGKVIGINTAIASNAQNIGFAIPINQAKRDIESVKKTGKIEVPFLGVSYITVTPDIAKKQKLPVDYGALVRGSENNPAVIKNSPAYKAGVKPEDIIVEVNGKKIDKDNPLGSVISQLSVGQTITIKIIRDGKEMILNATLEKRPKNL